MSLRSSLSVRERTLYSKLRQLLHEPGLLRGNLVEMRRCCGKPTCRCKDDPACKHRALYLGLSLGGRRRMIYIPADWEDRVRKWVDRHSKAQEKLEQISLIYLKRLQRREV